MKSYWVFPSEIQSRLTTVLRAYAEAAGVTQKQEALNLKAGIEVAWHPDVPSGTSTTSVVFYPGHQLVGASPLGRRPRTAARGFYPGVWETLHHCRGLAIGDKLERRNRMDSAPLLAEMTPGETNFARCVEHLLAKIDAPEYHHLTIEALVALGDFSARTLTLF